MDQTADNTHCEQAYVPSGMVSVWTSRDLRAQVARKGKRGVWLKDFGQALAMYWVLIQVNAHATQPMTHRVHATVKQALLASKDDSGEGKDVWCRCSAASCLMQCHWLCVQICFGWGVGISRIIDNKHSTADVVGGFVLGAMFGLVFVLKVCTRSVMMLLSGRCAYLGSSAARVCLTDNI